MKLHFKLLYVILMSFDPGWDGLSLSYFLDLNEDGHGCDKKAHPNVKIWFFNQSLT